MRHPDSVRIATSSRIGLSAKVFFICYFSFWNLGSNIQSIKGNNRARTILVLLRAQLTDYNAEFKWKINGMTGLAVRPNRHVWCNCYIWWVLALVLTRELSGFPLVSLDGAASPNK